MGTATGASTSPAAATSSDQLLQTIRGLATVEGRATTTKLALWAANALLHLTDDAKAMMLAITGI